MVRFVARLVGVAWCGCLASCAGQLLAYGWSQPARHRTAVEETMATVSSESGGRIASCYGISTVFQQTCGFMNVGDAELEAYLHKAGWTRASGPDALQGFSRGGFLITYENKGRVLEVTIRTR
jgi:hypothetical protein